MRIFTLLKAQTFFYFSILLFLIGFSNHSYSQCPTVINVNQSFCDSQSPTIASLQATDNGGGIKWYATATTPANEPLLATTPLESGEDYYVDDNSGTCGSRQVVNVTIYSRPFAFLAATTLCRESTIENLNTFVVGNNIQWYTSSTGGTALAAGTAISNGIYYASQTNPNTGCETLRVGIVVEIKIVSPPTGNSNQLICADPAPTVANLTANGPNISWFTTSTSGFPLNPSTPLINGQVYYAESFDSPCYSISRFPVTVTFSEPNDAGTNAQVSFCSNEVSSVTPFDLFGLLGGNPDDNGVWTGPASTTNGHLGTVNVSSFTTAGSPYIFSYTVSSSPNCQPVTSTVTIDVLPLPIAGVTPQPQVLCVTSPSVDLFTLLGNTAQTGGTWSPALASGTGVFNPAVDVSGSYTYTVLGNPPCIPASVSVQVTVNPVPNAGNDVANFTICSNQNAIDLFSLLGPNAQTGGTWSPALASGTGVLNPAVDVSATYTYTVAGIAPCVDDTATVEVIINQAPQAGNNNSITVCQNSPQQDLFALLGPNAQTGGTWSPALASGTSIFNPAVDLSGSYTYSLTGNDPCDNDEATITVIVNPIPNAGNDVANYTICSNQNAIDLFSLLGSNAQTGGTWSPALASGTGILNPAVDVSATYTYTVAGIAPCVDDTATVEVIINQAPQAGNNNSITVCQNSPQQDLFALLGPNAQTGGTWSPALASGTSIFNPAVDLSGSYTYSLTGNDPCDNDEATITVIVNPIPNAGNDVANYTICSNQNAIDLFSLLGSNAQTGGTWSPALASGTGILNPAIDVSATYTYTVIGIAPCLDDTATVEVIINQGPEAGNNNSITVCQNSPQQDLFALLGPNAQTGGTWSPALASGTSIFNPAIDLSGSYTYSLIGNDPCDNDEATITVIVNPIPNAGNDVANYTICSNQNAIDLFSLLGSNAQAGGTWSPALASGTGVLNPAVDVSATYTYTVAGIAPCVDDTATVEVIINQGPEAGNNNSITVCQNSPQQDLFPLLGPNVQTGGTWSPALASGTSIFNPAVDLSGSYTYSLTGNDPCDNDEATITVIVNPVPDAGENGSHIFCTNDSPQDLFNFLNGTPQTGGTWSPALASGTGVFNPLVDLATTYVYTIGGNLCDTDTASVTVTVVQSPIAGADGSLAVCENITSLDLTSGLDGTQQAGTWTDDNATGALNGTIFNPSMVGAGTYTFTYTVTGGTSPCTTDTATVTVTVNPLPKAGNFVPTSPVCTSVGTFDLNTLLTGQDLGGNWLDATNTIIVNPISITSLAAGTYNFTYQVTNSCGIDTQIVQLELLQTPQILTANVTIAPVCIGNSALIQFSGMTDGTYAITYSVSGVNTIATQTQTVTITSGTGSFTIPATSLTNVGNSTITFQNISNTVTNCQATLTNITSVIIVKPILDVQTSEVSIANTCLGSNVVVVFTNSSLPDGTYQFDYAIATPTPVSGNSGNVVISSGNGQFTIPGTIFTSAGNYSVTITSILSTNECSNPNESIVLNFEIQTPPNSGTFNGIITICPSAGTLDLFSLLNNENVGGTWTDSTNQTVISPLNIAGLSPATYSYTYTVTNSCGSVSTTVQFTILPSLNIAGATVSAQSTCTNFQSLVTISNATGISDGNYTITYVLSGANSFTETITIPFASGSASFPLAQTSLTNAGSTTITITDIVLTGVTCGLNGITFPVYTFEVQNLGTPSLVQEGNLFCETDNPTIASLSANILNGETVIWYNSSSGGTAYAETDLLVHGTTYYAALVAESGCEGTTRLEVTVDLTVCDDIVIPDGFSPNNDTINDTFEIKNLPTAYPNFKLEIFNRYGNLLYTGNKNTPNWDGTTSEKSLRVGSNLLPTGVYFYILYFNDGIRKPLQGRVYLSR